MTCIWELAKDPGVWQAVFGVSLRENVLEVFPGEEQFSCSCDAVFRVLPRAPGTTVLNEVSAEPQHRAGSAHDLGWGCLPVFPRGMERPLTLVWTRISSESMCAREAPF